MATVQRSLARQQLPAARQLGPALRQTRPSFPAAAKPGQLCQAQARSHSISARSAKRPSSCLFRGHAAGGQQRSPRATPFYSTQAAAAAATTKQPIIHDIFEPVTCTWQYIVADPETAQAVIIDPVLDYEPVTQQITTKSADALMSFARDKGYQVAYILETHAHADHITAAAYLQSQLPQSPPIGIGKRIVNVQELFSGRYGVPAAECDSVFAKLFDDDETFAIGNLEGVALHLPGHTPDHLGYMIGDNVFCGDSIFIADIGTARCDFPGGSAKDLYRSGRRLLSLPGHVKIWTGHDYPPTDQRKNPISYLTVDEHRARNKHLADGITEEQYVAMRTARDKTMGAPRLLHQSLQVNIRGGRMPQPSQAGLRLLRLPLKGGQW